MNADLISFAKGLLLALVLLGAYWNGYREGRRGEITQRLWLLNVLLGILYIVGRAWLEGRLFT